MNPVNPSSVNSTNAFVMLFGEDRVKDSDFGLAFMGVKRNGIFEIRDMTGNDFSKDELLYIKQAIESKLDELNKLHCQIHE